MKRIIVAIDGSDASVHAGEMAIEIAKVTGGEITLVYSVVHQALPSEVPFAADRTLEDALKIGDLMLEQVAAKLGDARLKRMCLSGSAAESVVDFAEAENADLIVVGSKGRGAVSRVLVGSTTDRIVHISKRPVLVVR